MTEEEKVCSAAMLLYDGIDDMVSGRASVRFGRPGSTATE